jgi:diaminopimelate decarboxylase
MEKLPPLQHIEKGLEVHDAVITSAVEKYGTPLFLYDCNMLEKNYIKLKNVLPEEVSIFYSVKANPNKRLASEFHDLGTGIEAASYGELKMLQEIGISGKDIILLGPGKSDELLELAVKMDVAFLVIESGKELERIAEIAACMQKRVSIIFRVNPVFKSGSMISMSGNTQFGMDEEEAVRHFLNKNRYPYLDFKGIHVYAGTGIMEEEIFLSNTEQILKLSMEMQKKTGERFSFLDIGGGLGVPVYDRDQALRLDLIKERLHKVVKEYMESFPHSKIVLEAGRYLIANTGIFLTRIMDIKEVKGKKYLILDGGTNNLLYSERFGIKIPPFVVVGRQKDKLEKVTLCGPLCTPTDRMASDVLIPECEVGDVIAFYQAGAYGLTTAPGLFLSHGYPKEVMWKDNQLKLIRKEFGWKEILKLQEVSE